MTTESPSPSSGDGDSASFSVFGSNDYEPVSLRDRIEVLPELSATKSRDYGRGYAQAVRDVVRLLAYHDPSYLTEACECEDVPDA